MKKRIFSVILILLLLLPCMLIPTSAAAKGNIRGVDYTRIQSNTMLKRKIEIDIGDRRFTGSLENGKQLDKDEIDRIIKGVMNERNINSQDLMRAEYMIKKAAEAQGIDLDMLEQLGLKFALGALGIDNVTDAYAVFTGEKELTSTAANALLGQIVSNGVEKAYGGIAGLVVSGLWACTEDIGKHFARLLEENDDLREALEASIMLNLFYNECNKRIEVAEKGIKGNTWRIVCNQTVWCDKTLFGEPVTQYWHLSCELTRTDYIYGDDEDPTNYGGVYRGGMELDIWHDVGDFDAKFLDKLAPKWRILACYRSIGCPATDNYSKTTLEKSLSSYEVEIHLNQDNMTSSGMTEFFSLRGFDDRSSFKLSHDILIAPPSGYWNTDGIADHTYPTELGPLRLVTKWQDHHIFSGLMSGNNRYPGIRIDTWSHFYDIQTYGAVNVYQVYANDKHSLDIPIVFDYHIFDDLRSGQGMLTVVGG